MNHLLRISILANAALAFVAVLVLRKPAAVPPAITTNPTPITATTETPSENPTDSAAHSIVVLTTNAFHWRALESTNYDELVANLRNVACPERTIRDILFADAERRFSSAEVAPGEPLPFWLAGRARAEADRRTATNRSLAQAAVVADLKRLFGVDWSPEENEMQEIKIQALSRMVVGPVSDEEHEQVWRWFFGTLRQQRSFREDRNSLLLAADYRAWDDVINDRVGQLRQILNPAAFEEFRARTSLLEEIFDAKLLHIEDLELTPEELRRVCLVKVREVGWLEEAFAQRGRGSRDDTEERQLAFTAALKSELTLDHFEEFVRVQDENYRATLKFTRKHNLPRATAQKIHAVQQAARTEFEQARTSAEAAGNPEALAAMQREVQAATEIALRQILGADAYEKFKAQHGQ